MEMYHGSGSDRIAIHPGLCLTDDLDAAENYAYQWDLLGTPTVATVHLDLTGLRVVEVDAYDRDSNLAVGDRDLAVDADVVVYDDEDHYGRRHRTWRIVSPAAVDACQVVAAHTLELD